MQIIVCGEKNVTTNMIKGALQQAKVQNADILHIAKPEEIRGKVTEESVVIVDWDGDPVMDARYVTAAKEANEKVPVILLCTKAKSGTVFGGMKAGATGVLNKPFEPEELVKVVAAALKQSKAKKPSVNVEFINPFIDATINVFKTMCQMDVHRKKLFLKDDHKMLGDVSGVMGLSGSATGSVVVSLPERLACIVVGRMLGEEPSSSLTPDVCDAVGELINMISGQAKASLVKTKYHFSISIPSVVSGPGHEISHRKGTPNIVVLFEADAQEFAIQVCLAPVDE
ncbi:MAG: chemotaxis protein CheX [Planctomycetes bacterium]|nr:chemotaxis protein CheX [Planctomycetota bacterium]